MKIIAGLTAAVGFFLVLGSAGTSDLHGLTPEVIGQALIGLGMMLGGIGLLSIIEKLKRRQHHEPYHH